MNKKMMRALAAMAVLLAPLALAGPAGSAPGGDSNIAVFDNDDYGDSDQETALVIADLEAGGHNVTTFDGITAAEITAALDGQNVLVIPELEGGDDGALIADLDDDAEAVIADFVDGGGRIVFFGSSEPDAEINGLFGFSVSTSDDGDACDEPEDDDVDVTAAATAGCNRVDTDTELHDGPATLLYVNDTTTLSIASLPEGSTVPYVDNNNADGAAVALMPFGDGMVVFLGYDWFPDFDEEEDGEVEDVRPDDAGDQSDAGRVSAFAEGDDPQYDDWEAVLDAVVSQPIVTISDVSVDEGGDAVFTVSIDGPSSQPVFVALATSDGSATGPDDFEPNAASVTIEPGATSATFTVPTVDDDAEEAAETFTLTGDTSLWGIVAGPGTATIAASDAAPVDSGAVDSSGQTPAATPTVANPTFTG
ncbi:Calx-beta domain-containing protein [Actinospongicola halichondriae]|uniref:Calx-beta domain-containing protein n=1 Tax=Actinospongicola halichondriae TaxID=3236844 RepID=UPI003D38DF5C